MDRVVWEVQGRYDVSGEMAWLGEGAPLHLGHTIPGIASIGGGKLEGSCDVCASVDESNPLKKRLKAFGNNIGGGLGRWANQVRNTILICARYKN